ncbi:MAG: hypothetical protein WC799_24825 [Desulfobacteraceae bacterium]|jgi:hypothetical protein
MAQTQLIKVTNLLLDINNPRFPEPADSQHDAINKMLELQKDKVIALAKDIAEKGLDPSENMMVIKNEDEPNMYTVYEGNRRLTALKVLNDPHISVNNENTKIFTKIKTLVNQEISEVNCVVFDDDSYEHWVNLKHTGQNNGVGRVEWNAPEKARHMARLGAQSFQNQLYQFIELHGEVYKHVLILKKHIKISNIQRLFQDPDVRIAFGLHSNDGFLYCDQPIEKFISEYKKVLDVMIELKENGKSLFTVDRIRSKKDREQFINDLKIKPLTEKSENYWKLLSPKNSATAQQNKPFTPQIPVDILKNNQSDSEKDKVKDDTESIQSNVKYTRTPKADRNNLIPSNLKLSFGGNKKCSRIFNELKGSLKFNDSINAIAVMLRVFLDLSVSSFIEFNNISNKNTERNPGLHDKVVMCAEFLRNENKITQNVCTSVTTASKGITKANGSLQQYVHNPHFNPEKVALNTEWDNFQPLFEAIWSPS